MFYSKNLQITSKLLTQGYRYHKLRKTFRKFFRSYSELLSKFGAISFREYVSKGITHSVFYGHLVYKLKRFKGETNFISSGSKIVKRLRRRQYDPVIIGRTIGLVLGPFTALYRSFLKRCTLTKKAVGTIWRALSKPPQRWQVPDPRSLWLLYTILVLICFCNTFLWPLRFGWLLSSVSIRRIIYKFLNVCPFHYTAVAVSRKMCASVNRFNHTSGVTVVTHTDRPKSVRNRCVIEVFGGFFMMWRCYLDFSVGVWAFVIGLSQISSFLSWS